MFWVQSQELLLFLIKKCRPQDEENEDISRITRELVKDQHYKKRRTFF